MHMACKAASTADAAHAFSGSKSSWLLVYNVFLGWRLFFLAAFIHDSRATVVAGHAHAERVRALRSMTASKGYADFYLLCID